MRSLGQHIRARRQLMGLTLEALCARVGCTKGYLSAIETGRRGRPPSEALLVRLERSLEMEEGELVRGARMARTPDAVRAELERLRRRDWVAQRFARLALDEAGLQGGLERMARDVADGSAGARVTPMVEGDGGWGAAFSAPVELPADARAVRVEDEAMRPAYAKGDIAVLAPSAAAAPGLDCLAELVSGESLFRRVYFDSAETVRLQPLDVAEAARVVGREEIVSLDVAVFVFRRVEGAA